MSDTPEWKQQFSPPNQRRDCIHGRLARSCDICGLEHDVFDLKRQLAAANQRIAGIYEKLANASLTGITKCVEVESLNERIAELESDKSRLDWLLSQTHICIEKMDSSFYPASRADIDAAIKGSE